MAPTDECKSCRVLVVEDESLLAFMIEDALDRLGHDVIGPVSRLDKAIALAQEARFDAAILDVTIRGGNIFPVAEILQSKGIPFVLSSGYSDWALPENLKGRQRLTKPFSVAQLDRALADLCADAAKVDSAG